MAIIILYAGNFSKNRRLLLYTFMYRHSAGQECLDNCRITLIAL